MYKCLKVILNRKQKEELVIKLAKEGKNTRDIAKVAHVSLKDIGMIIRNYLGEDENETGCSGKGLSTNSKAFKLFKEGKNLVDVAIILNVDTDEVLGMYNDYLRLLDLQKLMTLYREMSDNDFHLLEYLYHQLKCEGLANKKDIFNIVQMDGKLKNLNCELYETAEDIGRLNSAKSNLEAEVKELQKKIDHYGSMLLEREQYQDSVY
jgi:hypothetical protein